jgi:hypothetical protein
VQLLRGAKHADRDLAAIGDEDLFKHFFLWTGCAAVESATLTAAGNSYG